MGKRNKQFSASAGKSAPPAVGSIRVPREEEKKAPVASPSSMDTGSEDHPTVLLSHSLRARTVAQRKTIDKTKSRVKGTEMDLGEEDAAAAAAAKEEEGGLTGPIRSIPKSGRVWKQTQTQRFSAMVSKTPVAKSWTRKQQRRAEEKEIKERQRALKAAQEEAWKEERRKAKQRKQQKEENVKRSLVVQPITDTRKIKKMNKKQLKTIMTM